MKKTTALCMMVVAGTAFAEDKKAPEAPKDPIPQPKPAADLDVVKDWAKAWTCTGTNGLGEKSTGKFTIKKELDGHWYAVRFETAKTKLLPAFVGQAVFGIDAVSKSWVMTGYDNMGGWINFKGKEATAKAMTWEGEASDMGRKIPAKFLLTLEDKKKVKFVGEFGGRKIFEHDCK